MGKKKNSEYKKARKAKSRIKKELENKDNFIEDTLSKVKNSKKYFKAVQYLDNYSNNKSEWKFNKMLQVFILKYILIKSVFSKEQFEIFKEYYKNMSQKTKEVNLFSMNNNIF